VVVVEVLVVETMVSVAAEQGVLEQVLELVVAVLVLNWHSL